MAQRKNIVDRYKALAENFDFPEGSPESINWYNKVVRKGRKITNSDQVHSIYKRAILRPGKLISYDYYPKHEATLEYYDLHPLIIVLEIYDDGWSGVNLHYLSPKMRALLLIEINYIKKNYFRILEMVKRSKFMAPAYKRYLVDYTMSDAIEIPKEDWDLVVQLPFEAFEKAENKKVWSDSRKIINGSR